jgi:hypothetical protein
VRNKAALAAAQQQYWEDCVSARFDAVMLRSSQSQVNNSKNIHGSEAIWVIT